MSVLRIDSVNDTTFSMVMPPNEELHDILGKGLPPREFDIGGMSGGPIAAIQKSPEGLISWWATGIIYEGHQSFEIIKGARADLIDERGIVTV